MKFYITENAIARIKDFLSESGKRNAIRISCFNNGVKLHHQMDEARSFSATKDYMFYQNGIYIFVDKVSMQYLQHTTIHWLDSRQTLKFYC